MMKRKPGESWPAFFRRTGRAGAAKSGGKGGALRAQALSPERRREIAQKAARARWDTKPPEEQPT